MNTKQAIEIVVMGIRGCSACDGSGLVTVSPESPTGDCPRCREPGYKYRASGLDPDSRAEVATAIAKLEADALALEALSRIVRRALASGQLEKLEDARPYLLDEPANDPTGEPRQDVCLRCDTYPCSCGVDWAGNPTER